MYICTCMCKHHDIENYIICMSYHYVKCAYIIAFVASFLHSLASI